MSIRCTLSKALVFTTTTSSIHIVKPWWTWHGMNREYRRLVFRMAFMWHLVSGRLCCIKCVGAQSVGDMSWQVYPSSTGFNYYFITPLEDTCPSITRSSIATSENLSMSKLQWPWLGSFRPYSGRRGSSSGNWLWAGERCQRMIVIFNSFMTVNSWRSWPH